MQLDHYVGLLHGAEAALAAALRDVADAHGDEVDVERQCRRLAQQCDEHVRRLGEARDRYGEVEETEPLHSALFRGPRDGPLALLRDLQDLYLMACECDIVWTLVGQAAQGIRDEELISTVQACEGQIQTVIGWLRTRMKAAAPQALVVA